jgi:hypothetical protein
MSGLVDLNTNKSLPAGGVGGSGAAGAALISPAPVAQDPVGKLRVSEPQSLIDTDFEYGQQPTKWESIGLSNNRQSHYYIPQAPRVVTAVTGNGTRTVVVSMADTSGFVVGGSIFVQNSNDPNANGWYYVDAVSTNVSVSYTAAGNVAAGNQLSADRTYVYLGLLYSQCGIGLTSVNAFTNVGTTVSCTTTGPHGLSAGSLIFVTGLTAAAAPPNGAWVVATTPTANTFTFVVVNAPTGPIVNVAGQTNLFARTSGTVESRPYDGGVAFSAGSAQPNSQMIRQTRRYFRYQSGKAIQFSTGTNLCPPLFVTDITSSGTTATVTTRFAHNIAAGATIVVSGADQAPYNGTFTVVSAPTPTTLTYTMSQAAASSPAQGFPIRVVATNWFGSSNRVGFFDQQNGLFFEYDGQMLYAVWRSSVLQLEGTVSATLGSTTVTGVGTKFSRQIVPGDFIVIRGMSHRVLSIESNTTLSVSPEFRGSTVSGAIASKTVDTRVPRTQWADRLDGTGPSGYTLDLTRMQMLYVEYSWYGAGYARFGMRTTNGNIAYVHQFNNNNIQYEAYMRSGNLPAHYESNGISTTTTLTSTLGTGGAGTVINVASTEGFATSGVIRISAPGGTGVVEHIAYSSKTSTGFVVSARAQTGGQATAQTFTFSATAPVLVEFASPDTLASLSHWGSSTIMDGRYDDDKSLVFNYGMTGAITTTATNQVRVLMAIRVAPSVDNNTVGTIGSRETLNRMQLTLDSIGFYTTGAGYLINLVLNGFASGAFSGAFISPVQETGRITSSLAQVALNVNAVTVTGGESVYSGYTNPTGVTTFDLSKVRDLGNSILGGGLNNTVSVAPVPGAAIQANLYPDGPDVLYVVAIPLSATSSTIQARINWKEAQA